MIGSLVILDPHGSPKVFCPFLGPGVIKYAKVFQKKEGLLLFNRHVPAQVVYYILLSIIKSLPKKFRSLGPIGAEIMPLESSKFGKRPF